MGTAVCAVTHQEWFVVIYAPCTKSVHESVHDGTPTTFHTVALAVLQSDDHCGAIFGTDAKGTNAFSKWVQHRKLQPVVGQFAAAKLKQQTREPITPHCPLASLLWQPEATGSAAPSTMINLCTTKCWRPLSQRRRPPIESKLETIFLI